MPNIEAVKRWVELLSERAVIPFSDALGQHFKRARITRLCDCGCSSFDCETQPAADLKPLFSSHAALRRFEFAFQSNLGEPIDIVVFTDTQGLLAGLDICLGLANHAPLPKDARLQELLFTIPDL